MPLFILAGGELVLLFIGARIAWWILHTRDGEATRGAGRTPTGGASLLHARRALHAGPSSGSETLREAA